MQSRWLRTLLLTILVIPVGALAAGAQRVPPPRGFVPNEAIILLQQDVNTLGAPGQDAVRYGSAEQADLLRQIALATRATAQAQVEMLRQQNEIIRLLDRLTQLREAGR